MITEFDTVMVVRAVTAVVSVPAPSPLLPALVGLAPAMPVPDVGLQATNQASKQTNRQTGRQAGSQTDRQIGRQTDRQTDKQTDKQTDM